MIRLLVSVRSAQEALQAAAAGADLIDLKEPHRGALGALPASEIAGIVHAVRTGYPHLRLSATTGDFRDGEDSCVLAAVESVARCEVDYVKVGIAGNGWGARLLERLSWSARPIVPVLLCDDGVDLALWREACSAAFPAVMLDTRDKGAGTLFDCVDLATLHAVLESARAQGKPAGLAGALRLCDVPQLRALAPDFAGFRGAVCNAGRSGSLDPQKVRALADALAQPSVARDLLRVQ